MVWLTVPIFFEPEYMLMPGRWGLGWQYQWWQGLSKNTSDIPTIIDYDRMEKNLINNLQSLNIQKVAGSHLESVNQDPAELCPGGYRFVKVSTEPVLKCGVINTLPRNLLLPSIPFSSRQSPLHPSV